MSLGLYCRDLSAQRESVRNPGLPLTLSRIQVTDEMRLAVTFSLNQSWTRYPCPI